MNNKQQKFIHVLCYIFLLLSCKNNTTISTPIEFKSFPKKDYQIDETGNIISTEIDTSDFHSSSHCIGCHEGHVVEWKRSMHAYSIKDPIFFSGWKSEQSKRHETGERFCIQCHSPIAFVTGKRLDYYLTVEELLDDPELSTSIKEGVTCTVCHSFTGLSKIVDTGDDVAADEILYQMNPGEGIMYGPLESSVIQEPTDHTYSHQSEYNSLFKSSESCLPCHDFKIRGVNAEITFSEWKNIPQFGMAGLVSCQECHMPMKIDGNHSHEFVGVDIDLTREIPVDSLQYKSVEKLLQSSVELKFGGLDVADTIIMDNNILNIPVTVKSLTGHSLPSGTSFAREAWLETIVKDIESDTIVFSSGFIETDHSHLNLLDTNLLLYTSYLIGTDSDTVTSVTDAFDIIPKMLPGLESQVHKYEMEIDFTTINPVLISVRMRFRAFKPLLLEEDHLELLYRQPVFEMARLDTILYLN